MIKSRVDFLLLITPFEFNCLLLLSPSFLFFYFFFVFVSPERIKWIYLILWKEWCRKRKRVMFFFWTLSSSSNGNDLIFFFSCICTLRWWCWIVEIDSGLRVLALNFFFALTMIARLLLFALWCVSLSLSLPQ